MRRVDRVLGFFDWRFLVALTVLLSVVALVNGSLASADQRDQALAQVAHERKLSAAERERAAEERAQASLERTRILQGQEDLEGKYDRLITWLNAQRIVVPEEVLTGKKSSNNDGDGSDGNGGSGKQTSSKSGSTAPGFSAPAPPASAATPTPRRRGRHAKPAAPQRSWCRLPSRGPVGSGSSSCTSPTRAGRDFARIRDRA